MRSPILASDLGIADLDGPGPSGAAGGAGGAGGDFGEYGVDPSIDPELAMVSALPIYAKLGQTQM